jgi:hypothetical protein
MAKVGRMDLEDSINVLLAHDISIDLMYPSDLHFIRIDGGIQELERLKQRDRWASVNPLDLENGKAQVVPIKPTVHK